MEKGSEIAQRDFEASFQLLSPEEQYNLMVPSIVSNNGYLQWRIKTLLNSLETPDLLTLLPPEIQFIILSQIDGASLLRACSVSKAWNELLSSFNQLWKKKAKDAGVNIEEKPLHLSWKKAFSLSYKQLCLLEAGKAFREKYMDLQNSIRSIKALDYADGYLCTVSQDDFINIWQLEKNIPVLSFYVNQAVACVKLRPFSTLVCGHFSGILSSYDVTDMLFHCFKTYEKEESDFTQFCLLKSLYKMHSGPVFSCDFSEELQLLVSGSSDEKVRIWCLATGVQLHAVQSPVHWVLRVSLRPFSIDGKTHSILAMTMEAANLYCWPAAPPPKQDAPPQDPARLKLSAHNNSMQEPALPDRGDLYSIQLTSLVLFNESSDKFITPSFQITSKYICLIKQDHQEKYSTLDLHDINFRAPCISIPLYFKVQKLLAVGNRFALVLSVGKVLYTSTLIVLDLKTWKTVGEHSIPHSKMTTPDGAQIVVGEKQWLDGIKGWEFFGEGSTNPWDYPRCPPPDRMGAVSPVEGMGLEGEADCEESSRASPRGVTSPKPPPSLSCSSLILATGVRAEPGRIFTLWWGRERSKTKEE